MASVESIFSLTILEGRSLVDSFTQSLHGMVTSARREADFWDKIFRDWEQSTAKPPLTLASLPVPGDPPPSSVPFAVVDRPPPSLTPKEPNPQALMQKKECISTCLSNLSTYIGHTQPKVVQTRIKKIRKSIEGGFAATDKYVNAVIQDGPSESEEIFTAIRQIFKTASSLSNMWRKIYNSWKYDLIFDLFFKSSRIMLDIPELGDNLLRSLG